MKLSEVNKKEILNPTEINTLKTIYPNIPQDYLDYLMEIGTGTIMEMQFNVKPFLFNFYDLGLEKVYSVSDEIKFFGDNYNGDFAGFNLKNNDGTVVEFWHESGELIYTNKTFHQFIKDQMLFNIG